MFEPPIRDCFLQGWAKMDRSQKGRKQLQTPPGSCELVKVLSGAAGEKKQSQQPSFRPESFKFSIPHCFLTVRYYLIPPPQALPISPENQALSGLHVTLIRTKIKVTVCSPVVP